MMKEQTSVRFKISSPTLSVQDIQARTGLAPDETWKVGTPRGRFAQVEKENGFVLESKVLMQSPLDEHVKGMLKRLAPHAQHIGALTNEARIEFTCIVHRKVAPALRFERDDLRWLGVMGARLDIDIFIISEAHSKESRPSSESEKSEGSGQGPSAPPPGLD